MRLEFLDRHLFKIGQYRTQLSLRGRPATQHVQYSFSTSTILSAGAPARPAAPPRWPGVCVRPKRRNRALPPKIVAMRNRVGRVGNNFPLSSCDSRAAESPVSSPNSTESHALAQADGAQLF